MKRMLAQKPIMPLNHKQAKWIRRIFKIGAILCIPATSFYIYLGLSYHSSQLLVMAGITAIAGLYLWLVATKDKQLNRAKQ